MTTYWLAGIPSVQNVCYAVVKLHNVNSENSDFIYVDVFFQHR